MTKVIKIDPFEKKVTAAQYETTSELVALMGGVMMTAIPVMEGAWVGKVFALGDDEGLLKPNPAFSKLPFYHNPLAGIVVLTGVVDSYGDSTDCALGVEEVAAEVTWVEPLEVFMTAAGEGL